ncbi:hypothetical protein ACD661_15695 [Legionella lytica]|uniref:Outer membrane protein beta-barrel domain-containing protein n=1 Tax=Legionella lytica TaxID=96232 RepID=A0ABW8DCU0_9GAMM
MKKIPILFAVICFGFWGNASACYDCSALFHWGFSGSLGATHYTQVYNTDGYSVLGRLSFDVQYSLANSLDVGLETGVQNGNTMRLDIPKPTLDLLGGEPVSIIVKPTIDVLATAKITPSVDAAVYGLVKAGVAYRQMQVDRNEVNDLSKISPEVQAGLGYTINTSLAVHLLYQHIFGNNPNYEVDTQTERGSISNIPSQDSLLLGITLLF